MTRTHHSFGAALAALLCASAGAFVPAAGGQPAEPSQRAGLVSRAYFNNPYDTAQTGNAGNVTRDLLIDRFHAASPGSKVRMMTFNITDTGVSDAMIEAMEDGVTVQVIMAKGNCDATAARELKDEASTHPGSFVKCSKDTTRSPGGNIHAKYLTFSDVGGQKHITIVGSANATVEGYADQWVDMYQYVERRDVSSKYNKVFDISKKLDPDSQNYFEFSFNGGKAGAQFLPVDDETPEADDDPVLRRINTLPANARVQIATYAMGGARGGWLASSLIARKEDGMRIRMLVGPPASDQMVQRLRSNGIKVVDAFDAGCGSVAGDSCNYIHLKLMTATYTRNDVTQHRVWTGSDNWSDVGLGNDEVAHKINGKAAWKQYTDFLSTVRRKYA